MTDASERERLQVLLAKYIGDSKYLLPVFEATNILHAMSADAETIFELQTRISCRDADIDVMQEELAAQSAELERVRKDAERYRWLREGDGCDVHIEQADDDGDMVFISGYELDDLDAAIDAALATPSAAGGEKEGG